MVTYEEHMESYATIDVALDTYPYNGTTTTCEALLMGVPVITVEGDIHLSRVGVSLLKAVGHPEWIASTSEDMLVRAVTTALNRPRTKAMRQTLRAEFKASIICNNEEQSKRFAAALITLWETWCKPAKM
jgi:predicted O-linked N-acetylglucosamine transferase (SPINDLY family)